MKFSREISLAADPGRVWKYVWDVGRIARALIGSKEIREVIPHQRYEASVDERVGPFRMRVPVQIDVLEAVPPTRLRAEASGRDPTTGNSLHATFELTVQKTAKGSRLAVNADVEVRGALAALAQGIIRKRAEGTMERFTEALRRGLEDDTPRARGSRAR